MLTSRGTDALDALDEGVEHQRMIVEIAGLEELDARMARRDLVGLPVDPLDQDAGEQEVGEHHDPAKAETARPLQHGVDPRMGDAAVADLGPAEAHALPQHARDLGDVAVGVGVGGAAPDHRQQGLFARNFAARLRERRLDPVAAPRANSFGSMPSSRPKLDPNAMVGGILVEHRWHVVLDVAGGEQHARHGQHVIDAARPQPVEPLAQHRPRELQKAALDGIVRQALGQAVDQATNSSIASRSREPWPQTITPILPISGTPRDQSSPGYQPAPGETSAPWLRHPAAGLARRRRMLLIDPATLLQALLLAMLLDAADRRSGLAVPPGAAPGRADRPGRRLARTTLARSAGTAVAPVAGPAGASSG